MNGNGIERRVENCDFCTKKDEKGKIVGGDFCIVFSGTSGVREKFSEDKLASNGCILFWSRQINEPVEGCSVFQEQAAKEREARLAAIDEKVIETMKALV